MRVGEQVAVISGTLSAVPSDGDDDSDSNSFHDTTSDHHLSVETSL